MRALGTAPAWYEEGMRWWSAWWALSMVVACSDKAFLEREDNGVLGLLDAGVLLDARRPTRHEEAAVDSGPPTLASADGSTCAVPLAPPGAEVCAAPDPNEPNQERAPALLTLAPSCASLVARAADKDEDAYRFSTVKADPVLVELSYRDAKRADLGFQIADSNGRLVTRVGDTRSTDSELESTILLAEAKAQYDVRVVGTQVGQCVPYALRVNSNWCTDAYEDNDSPAKATQLSWHGDLIELSATGSRFEADYYAFAPAKADPILVSGSYEVDASSNLQIRRVLSNITGLSAIDVPGQRVGTREAWKHWLRSDTPQYIVQLAPSGEGCVVYNLRIDAAACSDAFEDNDRDEAAAPLTPGQEITGTAFAGDDDFFTATALPTGGSCTLQYELAAGSAQQLRLDVYSKATGVIASGIGQPAPGASQTVTVRWSERGASVLDVRAQLPDDCQSYRLRCDTL